MRVNVAKGLSDGSRPRCNVRGYGHSIAEGYNATRMTVTSFYPRLFSYLDPAQYTCSFKGHSGNWTGEMLGQATDDVAAYVDPNAVNVFLYLEVVNSMNHYIGIGMSTAAAATQAIADHRAMFALARAAGYQGIGSYTFYHPDGYGANALQCIDLINTGLRAMLADGTIDFLIELATAPEFQVTGAGSTTMSGDGLHPNDNGHQCMADRTLAPLRAFYEGQTAATHTFLPTDVGNCLWWYEADAAWLVKDGSNNVSTLKDRSSWAFDLTAAGALRPVYVPSNAAFGNQPTVNGLASTMTSALSVDLTFTKTVHIVNLYTCASSNTVVCELSTNSASQTTAFRVQSNPPGIFAPGNVGLSQATATAPGAAKSVSFVLDNTVSTAQCNLLVEAVTAPGIARVDAPNTNAFGSFTLSLFGRAGGALPSNMSLAASIAFSRKLTGPELAQVLAYLTAKWPH